MSTSAVMDVVTTLKGNVGIGTTNPTQKLHVNGFMISYPLMTIIEEQQPSGTSGGDSLSGQWNILQLNTRVVNNLNLAALVAGVFTLPIGTYYINASAPAFSVYRHRIRLFNTTANTTSMIGTAENLAGVGAQTRSFMEGVLVVSTSASFQLQHYTSGAAQVSGLGSAGNIATITEVYARITITQIA